MTKLTDEQRRLMYRELFDLSDDLEDAALDAPVQWRAFHTQALQRIERIVGHMRAAEEAAAQEEYIALQRKWLEEDVDLWTDEEMEQAMADVPDAELVG